MIGTYIKELLKTHSRVIVPDLGAFLKKNDNPDLIYFNEFLRFNDGLLVDYLSEKENIDKIEAAKRIKNYVSDITSILKDKQPVNISDIGTLFIDSTEKIQLKIDLLKEYLPEESPEKTAPKKEKSGKSKDDKKTPETPIELIITEPPKEIKETLPPPVIEKNNIETNDKQAPNQEKTSVNMEKPKPIEHKKRETIIIPPKPRSNKSGNKWLWYILIVLLIAALVLLWFFIIKPKYFDKKRPDEPFTKTVPAATPLPVTDSTSLNNISPKQETRAHKMHYVVVGCFAMESNADRLVQSLKEKGFNAEKFAKIEELYYVSVGSYPNMATAQTELNKMNAQGYECWLKTY